MAETELYAYDSLWHVSNSCFFHSTRKLCLRADVCIMVVEFQQVSARSDSALSSVGNVHRMPSPSSRSVYGEIQISYVLQIQRTWNEWLWHVAFVLHYNLLHWWLISTFCRAVYIRHARSLGFSSWSHLYFHYHGPFPIRHSLYLFCYGICCSCRTAVTVSHVLASVASFKL